jgi:hypothetical protein
MRSLTHHVNIARCVQLVVDTIGARLLGYAATGVVLAGVSGAHAQEYCVQCAEPAATYRCVIEDARPGVVPSLQLHCIQRMATLGGHASCSVKRGVTVFDCDAPVKRVSVTDGLAVQPGPAGASVSVPTIDAGANPTSSQVSVPQSPGALSQPAPVPSGAIPAPPPAPLVQGEPKTMLEAAQQAKAATDKQMEKANATIKSSAEKTGAGFKKMFDCIGSFFKRCGDTN